MKTSTCGSRIVQGLSGTHPNATFTEICALVEQTEERVSLNLSLAAFVGNFMDVNLTHGVDAKKC